jgi:two-component system phosphate regulon response regulator PhoB
MLMSKERVLVIEDEPDILEMIRYNLDREGYRVSAVVNGEDGFERAQQDAPDLVLLDLMLPGLDGLEICRRLKGDPVTRGIPIIMVTAKGDESDVVLGLGLGADDYVSKPFSPKELVARVKAVLRRSPLREEAAAEERLSFDGVLIDAGRHRVFVNNDDVQFTATEFRLLHFLATHPGRIFTRDHLLSRIIEDAAVVGERNIDVHVRSIRGKLGPHRDLIETVRGVGYRFSERKE